ncbi:MAG: ClbS/DfsB family four-helix bundle protein [Roseiflexaceae bacterium]|nr:ClbS/DfsB family four-helix bundle protein [Roseiflexus sp.]MDW8214307.1 ClbS/DfsB family four-helix bundle protein [Roseiflexaceae bacterium]
MKRHILAALREQFEQWDAALARLGDREAAAPLPSSSWTIKDIVVHLWAWQQRTIARVEAAIAGHEPVFPERSAESNPDSEGSVDQINVWIAETHRDLPWSLAYRQWREGYLHLLDISDQIDERDLLDPSRYPWLDGRPLALILLATYDHHQEHGSALGIGYS